MHGLPFPEAPTAKSKLLITGEGRIFTLLILKSSPEKLKETKPTWKVSVERKN